MPDESLDGDQPGERVVLASASPRRRDLLEAAGLRFEILPADVDETIDSALTAGQAAEDLSLRKARAVASRLDGPAAVIGSDTLVVLGEDTPGDGGAPRRRYLEKAADEAEAKAMLEALSGTRHRVITGVAVVLTDAGGETVASMSEHETTFVTMRELESAEIAAYVASGEWRGKAGSYGIQGTADRFVVGLEGGGFDNVVGLPVQRTLRLLRAVSGRAGGEALP